MIRDLDCVKTVEDIPNTLIKAGMIGAIVHIFSKPNIAYLVEFSDSDGQTIEEIPLLENQIEKYQP